MVSRSAFGQDELALLTLARQCHGRGWSFATSGNYSIRVSPRSFLITPSGFDKGTLGAGDLLLVDDEGRALEPGFGAASVPSAETLLHAQIYRRRPRVHCIAHTHSLAATMTSRAFADEGRLSWTGYEIVKALAGVDSHEAAVHLPIFANDQDMARLARHIDAEIGDNDTIHGYLLAGHGLYTWGKDVEETRRHLEALEFLLDCSLYACFPPMMGRG